MFLSFCGKSPRNEGAAFVAPNATVQGDVILKPGSTVWYGAVLRGDDGTLTLGENSNVQDNAVLHCDVGGAVTLGRSVTVGHSAVVHGCTVGDGTLIGPHAIYTVSGELLKWAHRFAMEHQIPIHLHLAETEGEVKDSLDRFGLTPVRYLYKLGVLSPRLIIAHGIYIDDDELRMLADHEVKVVHNPASNMKLASGLVISSVRMVFVTFSKVFNASFFFFAVSSRSCSIWEISSSYFSRS